MGTPVFLKFARLISAVLFIRTSADFIYASLSTTKHGITPDFADVEAARTRSVYMSSGLQLFDNVLVEAAACRAASLTSLHTLAAFHSAYTGRISTRYGSSVMLQVRPSFPVLLCYAHTPSCLASHTVPEEPVRPCLDLRLKLYCPNYPQLCAARHGIPHAF